MKKSIKINFNDGSFILLELVDDNKTNVIMCGRKNSNSVVMSSSNIDKEQAKEIIDFLNNWVKSS